MSVCIDCKQYEPFIWTLDDLKFHRNHFCEKCFNRIRDKFGDPAMTCSYHFTLLQLENLFEFIEMPYQWGVRPYSTTISEFWAEKMVYLKELNVPFKTLVEDDPE